MAKQGGKCSNKAARMKVQEALSLAAKMAALGMQEIHGTFAQVFEFANQLKGSHFVGWASCDSDHSFDIDSALIHVGMDNDTSSGDESDDSNRSVSSQGSSVRSSVGGASSNGSSDASCRDSHLFSRNESRAQNSDQQQCDSSFSELETSPLKLDA